MKVFPALAVVFLCVGVVFFVTSRRDKLPDEQAGQVYTENEDGELVPADETPVATKPRDIRALNAMRDLADEQQLSNDQWLREFALTERSGKKISSQDLMGEPYVAGFFFTLCPTICINQNTKIQQLQAKFNKKPIRFLSISCDPEVDTPEVLTEYAEKFDADPDQWLFLTGDMKHIERVGGEMFSLAVKRRFHAEKFALVDANGDIAGFYDWADPVQYRALQDDIEAILAAGGVFPEDEATGEPSSTPEQ